MEGKISFEELPKSAWPVGMCLWGIVLIANCPTIPGQVGAPGLFKKLSKQAGKQDSSLVPASVLSLTSLNGGL